MGRWKDGWPNAATWRWPLFLPVPHCPPCWLSPPLARPVAMLKKGPLWSEVAARSLGIPTPLRRPWHSPHRTLEPLETEGAARSMLSSFLPPVPSLPSDPPEHFPLRKTGEWDRQVRPLLAIKEGALNMGCRGRRANGQRGGGGVGPSNPGAPPVSEPNLKLRYKPKKSLERRKNPLLRKESAPPSLRRRPAETLGGEA